MVANLHEGERPTAGAGYRARAASRRSSTRSRALVPPPRHVCERQELLASDTLTPASLSIGLQILQAETQSALCFVLAAQFKRQRGRVSVRQADRRCNEICEDFQWSSGPRADTLNPHADVACTSGTLELTWLKTIEISLARVKRLPVRGDPRKGLIAVATASFALSAKSAGRQWGVSMRRQT